MLQYRHPVFLCGENPGLTLFAPGTEQAVAIASYWNCTYSQHGAGHALTLWVAPRPFGPRVEPFCGIFTDNLPLARWLTDSLTRHFPEFRDCPVAEFPYHVAQCGHTTDGRSRYTAECNSEDHHIAVAWADLLDQKHLTWPRFPAGPQYFDLLNVIFPCGQASVEIDGHQVPGIVQTAIVKDRPASSAFLALCETWIGPLPPDESA